MKKLFLIALVFGLNMSVFAQADKLMIQAYKDAKEKSDKDILNEKNKLKARTWVTRASTYEDIAMNPASIALDSNAAQVVIDSYKKAIELDTKDGKMGAIAKEAQKALTADRVRVSLLQVGNAHYQVKNFKKAKENFGGASSLFPNDTLAHQYYGIAAYASKDMPSMLEGYNRYMDVNGTDASVYYTVYQYYDDSKDSIKALATLDRGIKLLKKGQSYNDLVGVKTNYLISKKMFDEALVSFEGMAKEDPKNDQVLVNIGIIYDNKMQTINTKISSLSKSLSGTKGIDESIAAKSQLLKDYTDESKRVKDNMKKQPKRAAEFKKSLSNIEESMKQVKADIDALTLKKVEADAKKVNQQKVLDEIAALKSQREGFQAKSIASYKRALEANANSFDALFNLGAIYFNDGVEIKKPYDDMNPSSADYKANGVALEEKFKAKFNQALPYFEKAYSIKNDDYTLNETLKNTYMMLKMQDKFEKMNK